MYWLPMSRWARSRLCCAHLCAPALEQVSACMHAHAQADTQMNPFPTPTPTSACRWARSWPCFAPNGRRSRPCAARLRGRRRDDSMTPRRSSLRTALLQWRRHPRACVVRWTKGRCRCDRYRPLNPWRPCADVARLWCRPAVWTLLSADMRACICTCILHVYVDVYMYIYVSCICACVC